MTKVINDEIINLGSQKFHYRNYTMLFGSKRGSAGIVELSEIDDQGKENGLFIRIHYDGDSKSYSETDPLLIGTKKDGELSGTRYLFEDGKLIKVKANDKIITPQDTTFLVYEKNAPDFKTSFKLLKNIERSMEGNNKELLVALQKLNADVRKK